MRRLSFCVVLVLSALVYSVSNAETLGTSHALLIGIRDYSGSEGVSSLLGTPNDVVLV